MSADDYTFGIGDRVLVGTNEGIVKGQRNENGHTDHFTVQFIDDEGFPFRREFAEYFIEKARVH